MTLSRRGRRAATEEAVPVIPAAFIVTGVATTDTPLRALQAPRVPTVATRAVVGAKSEALHNTHQVLALTAPVVRPLAHQKPLNKLTHGHDHGLPLRNLVIEPPKVFAFYVVA